MASGNYVLDKGFRPAGPIAKYRAVKLTGNPGEVAQIDTASDVVLGVSQFAVMANEIPRGKDASIRLMGITPWEAGEPLNIGDEVACSDNGRAVLAGSDPVQGLVLADPATKQGDRVTVLLRYTGKATTSVS